MPPSALTAAWKPEKSTCTTWLIGIPKLAVMVLTSWLAPELYDELMRLYVPNCWASGGSMLTTVSRGMERTWIDLVVGVTRHSCTTSLRCPVTSEDDPKACAAALLSPTRVSEPMTRRVKGAPLPADTSSAMWTLLIWS